MPSLTERMIRAARLDVRLYEEVENDREAMGQTLTVVILSSLAAGISTLSFLTTVETTEPVTISAAMGSLIMATLVALGGWLFWAVLTYFIGTRLLPEPQTQADIGQLLRTTGFSSAPGILRIVGVVPGLWFIVMAITSVWMLVSMVIAVRQALDYRSTWRAVGVCLIGWLIQAFLLILFTGVPHDIQVAV